MDFKILDYLLLQVWRRVEFKGNEWVWVQSFPNGNSMIVHGAKPGYTQSEAYEDALRDALGIIPIDDEKAMKI